VRFQQTRVTQRDMVRVDSTPLKYHKDDGTGRFVPVLDPKLGYTRGWNLKKLLGSHENAHIAFTLSVQAVMGAFLILTLGTWLGVAPLAGFSRSSTFLPTVLAMIGLMAFGLARLNLHLGKPLRFYRGFNNWRLSPVSREIAGVSLFFAGLSGYGLITLFPGLPMGDVLKPLATLAALLGTAFGGYYMVKLYRIKARPFWDHWQTGSSFAGTGLALGGLLLALSALAGGALTPALGGLLGGLVAAGLALESIGLVAHARDLRRRGDEGAASLYEQSTQYGFPYGIRNTLLAVGFVLAADIALAGSASPIAFSILAVMAMTSAILGRALFYVLVIPTTMPGAFFWRNKGFVEHAKEMGLAEMPQLGVVPDSH
jgi:DMSO reductase anchor subunit